MTSRFHISFFILVTLLFLATSCATPAAPTSTTETGESAAAEQPDTEQPAAGEEVEFTILTNFTPDIRRGEVLQSLIEDFNAQHEGEIQIVSNTEPDWPTLQQKIRSMIAAGTPPDIFLYNFNPNDLSRETSGELMNWAPYLEADPAWRDRFRPENLEALTIEGEVVGIPSDQAPVLCYYHKDLFEQAGIDAFPATWEEFFEAAAALQEQGVAAISLMTADDAWHAMNALTYLGVSAGGADTFAVGQPLDSPAVTRAAETLTRLFEYSTPDAVGANYAVSSRNFLSKNAAVIIDGPWLISSIQSELEDPSTVGVAACPTFADGEAPAGFIVTDSINPWAAAAQPTEEREQALVEWMKFLTSEESVRRFSVEGDYPLAVEATFTEEDLSNLSPLMAQVLEVSNAAPLAVVSAVRNVTPAAQAELPALLEGLALGQLSPEQFAAQLQSVNQ